MSSNKNNKNQKDNDLTFTPMNIQDSLKLNNFPTPNISGGPMSTGTMYMCFPAPAINMITPSEDKCNKSDIAPLTPYPSNIPNIEKTQISPPTINNNYNSSPNNSDKVPSSFPSNSSNLEYPSEVNSDDLFSYNKPRINENYNNDSVNPLDILRNFVSEDIELSDYSRSNNNSSIIDDIFKKIEDNNSIVLATMKAYRIPYPIAKLIIKNIIKLTLEYKGR